MAVYNLWLGLLLAGALSAQTPFFPLHDLRPGMRGIGKTVFAGDKVEDFQVEILGVLENVGPKQSIILGRLSGGPLDRTGVMQGMSGSPVYIDGKLVGAVAMAFAFSKEPIAGIRPIQEMLRVQENPLPRTIRATRSPFEQTLAAPDPVREVLAGGARLVNIATPLAFGGFTGRTLDHFAPQLRALGLEPLQGVSGGGKVAAGLGHPGSLQPGSMITVQLLAGDMSVGADGTLTYIDGSRMLAFGHRFLEIGSTELPFTRSEVLTLLPNLSTSFKISSPREWMGTITEDRNTAIAGELGHRAALVPLSISLTRHTTGRPAKRLSYQMEMINDPVLSPLLLQMAVFSTLDATEQLMGSSSYFIRGDIEFDHGEAPIRSANMYSGDMNMPAQVSMATAVPLAYILQSGFEKLQLKGITLDLESFERKRQLQVDQIWSSRREARPGESIDLNVVLTGENGFERTAKVSYTIPIGAPAGPLMFTVADANTMNFTDFRQLVSAPPRSATQLVSFMNALRPNTRAYVRVWRADPGFEVQGEILPDPPPSLSMILARTQASSGVPSMAALNSKIAELEIPAGDMAVSGSKTIQVDIKE